MFEAQSDDTRGSGLATGDWIMRCEARTLDDIRALGGNDIEDERRFATAARVSEINLAMYRKFAQPFVRALVTPHAAEFMQQMHSLRLQYQIFSDANPFMRWVNDAARQVREQRRVATDDNPFLQMQESASRQIVNALDAWRDMTEKASEAAFLSIYGSAALQAAVGIDPTATTPMRKADKSSFHMRLVQDRIAELKARDSGGRISGSGGTGTAVHRNDPGNR